MEKEIRHTGKRSALIRYPCLRLSKTGCRIALRASGMTRGVFSIHYSLFTYHHHSKIPGKPRSPAIAAKTLAKKKVRMTAPF